MTSSCLLYFADLKSLQVIYCSLLSECNCMLWLHCCWMAAPGKVAQHCPHVRANCQSQALIKHIKLNFYFFFFLNYRVTGKRAFIFRFVLFTVASIRHGSERFYKTNQVSTRLFFLPKEKGKTLQENIQQRFKKRWQVWQLCSSLTGTGICRKQPTGCFVWGLSVPYNTRSISCFHHLVLALNLFSLLVILLGCCHSK